MYRAVAYIRCSKYNENSDNSLEVQIEIIKRYIESKPDIIIDYICSDNGYTGLDFLRPGFIEMMNKIEKGECNCILIKDLSRFGRDYIQTGMYVQYLLPNMNIRVISVCDGYDSENTTEIEKYFMIPIRNYMNDTYSRDISIKVRRAIEVRRINGICTLNKVAYGYVKINGELLVDKNIEPIIKKIYRYSLEGYSLEAIADLLNKKSVITPYEYRKLIQSDYMTPLKKEIESKWYAMMIKRILMDEIYIGTLVQGKVKKINYKMKERCYMDSSKWIRKYNNHCEIIDNKTFEIVNRLLKYDIRCRNGEKKCHFLAGILFCGNCNKGMLYRKGNKKDLYICLKCNMEKDKKHIKIDVYDIKHIIVDYMIRFNENYGELNEVEALKRENIVYIFKRISICSNNRIKIELV